MSKETVILNGHPSDPEVTQSADKIKLTGREVKFLDEHLFDEEEIIAQDLHPQKNLPDSVMKIIESENTNHCIVQAFDQDGNLVAEAFPENEEQHERMIANLSEHYNRVDVSKIENQTSEL